AVAITRMLDTPTPNVSNIDKLLPPPPLPAFEVAVIRPSKSDNKESQARLASGDQVFFSGTERRLISLAWDISEKTIFNAPPYTDDKVWEISAKLPTPNIPQVPGKRPQVDFDQVRLMLQGLLIERFGLKEHIENRPGNAYTLYAGTPRLKKADPANRASCSDRVPPGEKDPRTSNPLVTQYMHCNNVTIDQFARELQAYSGFIIKTPVLNSSGIEGRYDLTLSFTGLHRLEMLGLAQGGATPPAGAPHPEGAGDPDRVVLMQDAVAKQLGLKLVLEKRPIPAFVVDSMQEKPTEN
ncbi:MAG TPA: TIGR03435 family protein, partial [Acidobacteriaceae bacterium]|nr:TIGR03435 family protein [Acidobacteriaceae bacterium]